MESTGISIPYKSLALSSIRQAKDLNNKKLIRNLEKELSPIKNVTKVKKISRDFNPVVDLSDDFEDTEKGIKLK